MGLRFRAKPRVSRVELIRQAGSETDRREVVNGDARILDPMPVFLDHYRHVYEARLPKDHGGAEPHSVKIANIEPSEAQMEIFLYNLSGSVVDLQRHL